MIQDHLSELNLTEPKLYIEISNGLTELGFFDLTFETVSELRTFAIRALKDNHPDPGGKISEQEKARRTEQFKRVGPALMYLWEISRRAEPKKGE